MAEISGVQHARRRSTFQQLNLFVGSSGEIAADMTFMRLSLADGVTAGGWFAQKGNITRQSFPAGSITRTVALSDATEYMVTAQNTSNILLPSAAAYPAGQVLTIIDSVGNAGTQAISINTATSTEKIVGTATTGTINSTQTTIPNNGIGVRLAALSTAGRWAIW